MPTLANNLRLLSCIDGGCFLVPPSLNGPKCRLMQTARPPAFIALAPCTKTDGLPSIWRRAFSTVCSQSSRKLVSFTYKAGANLSPTPDSFTSLALPIMSAARWEPRATACCSTSTCAKSWPERKLIRLVFLLPGLARRMTDVAVGHTLRKC